MEDKESIRQALEGFIERFGDLSCVTGISEATSLIQTGDPLTVDGYLGIVTVGSGEL